MKPTSAKFKAFCRRRTMDGYGVKKMLASRSRSTRTAIKRDMKSRGINSILAPYTTGRYFRYEFAKDNDRWQGLEPRAETAKIRRESREAFTSDLDPTPAGASIVDVPQAVPPFGWIEQTDKAA